MKTRLLLLFTILFAINSNSQNFAGKAIYKTHRKSNINIDSATLARNPGIEKQLQAQMNKLNQKTFILDFNRFESVYKEDVGLSSPVPKPQTGGVFVMSVGGGGGNDVLYKNIKEGRVANKRELMSKVFLIKDSLVKYDWKLTGKTKNIGKYTCYQAVYDREVENMKMENVNGEFKETTTKEMRKTTAWYTTDIPISNGPGNYGGLPGLILEINDGNSVIVCTEIVINSSEKIEINEPTKGKKVTQKEFEKISREKSKEMMDRFKSRNGRGFRFNIGG